MIAMHEMFEVARPGLGRRKTYSGSPLSRNLKRRAISAGGGDGKKPKLTHIKTWIMNGRPAVKLPGNPSSTN